MRKQEQRLWDRMRAAKDAAPVRLERIENLVGVGTPDIIAIRNSQVTWCELKALNEFPVRSSSRVLGEKGLSVSQRNWHYEWLKNGGRSVILVGIGPSIIYTIPGFLADSVNMMSRRDLEKYSIADDWIELFDYFGDKQ